MSTNHKASVRRSNRKSVVSENTPMLGRQSKMDVTSSCQRKPATPRQGARVLRQRNATTDEMTDLTTQMATGMTLRTPQKKNTMTETSRRQSTRKKTSPSSYVVDCVSDDSDDDVVSLVSDASSELGAPSPPITRRQSTATRCDISDEDESVSDVSSELNAEQPSPQKRPRRRLATTTQQATAFKTPVVRYNNRSRRAVAEESACADRKQSVSSSVKKTRRKAPRTPTTVNGGGGGLEKAKARFHASAVPDRLPCRDDEFATVHAFVDAHLRTAASGCLYISGVPGTGKTATVHQVVKSLEYDESLCDFNYIEVNGMRLTEPNQVFCEIYRQLIDDSSARISTNLASLKLDRLFDRADVDRPHTVLLVDELDMLCTRKQHILYQLFDWANRQTARLTVLAVANTLDLPERMLSQRVTSRLGMSRLCFQPYDHKQIEFILQSRLEGLECIGADALQLASRKVAAVSGDLRKAMDICKRAIEIAMQLNDTHLTIAHIQSATKELASTPRFELIKRASVHQRHILRAAVSEYQRTGHDEMDFGTLYRQYTDISQIEGTVTLPATAAYLVLQSLSSCGLVVARRGGAASTWTRVMRLGVAPDDLTFALNNARDQEADV